MILWIRPSGNLLFASNEGSGEPGEGDTIISFGPKPPQRDQEKIVNATTTEREARAEKARMTSEAVKPKEG